MNLVNPLLSPTVRAFAPYIAGGLFGGILLGKCVFEVPKSHLIKNIVENLIMRPLNAAACATLVARLFTPIAPLPAFAMGGLIFLAARVCMFVMGILVRKQWDHQPEGNEKKRLDFWSYMSMPAGAVAGWQLGNLALAHWQFAPISLPVIVGVGVGTLIPAVIGWEVLKRISEFGFRKLGWKELPTNLEYCAEQNKKEGN